MGPIVRLADLPPRFAGHSPLSDHDRAERVLRTILATTRSAEFAPHRFGGIGEAMAEWGRRLCRRPSHRRAQTRVS